MKSFCKQIYFIVFMIATAVVDVTRCENFIECEELKQNRRSSSDCTFKNVVMVHANGSQIISEYDFRYSDLVRNVNFINCQMHEVPRIMFEKMPKISNLTMEATGLTDELNRYVFEKGKNLIGIDLAHNNITIVGKSTFMGPINVEYINLSWNKIMQVDVTAFMHCSKLIKLNMAHNVLKHLPETVFQSLAVVTTIDLSSNDLIELPENMFENCANLRTLRLAGNNLVQLQLNLPLSLANLDIGHNRLIGCFINSVTNPVPSIRALKNDLKVSAANNSLSHFDISPNFTVLHLDLSRNLFTNLSNISNIETLIELNLSFNPLLSIPINSFDKMSNLLFLHLEQTYLDKIEFGVFSRSIKLKHLDLSYNKLTELDLDVFAALSNIEEISFIGNRLTKIDHKGLTDVFPRLRFIGISDNDWSCKTLAQLLIHLNKERVRLLDDENVAVKSSGPNLKGINCKNVNEEKIEEIVITPQKTKKSTNENDLRELTETKSRLIKMNNNMPDVKSNMIPTYYEKATQQDVSAGADIKAIKIMVFILLLINVVFFGIKLGRYIKTKKSSRSIRLSGGVRDENFMDDLVS